MRSTSSSWSTHSPATARCCAAATPRSARTYATSPSPKARAGVFLGCGALAPLRPAPRRGSLDCRQARGQGTGRRRPVLRALLEEAEEQGVTSVCLFTRIPDFFFHFGFRVVDRTVAARQDLQGLPDLPAPLRLRRSRDGARPVPEDRRVRPKQVRHSRSW